MNDTESRNINQDEINLADLNLDDSLTDEAPLHQDVQADDASHEADESGRNSKPDTAENKGEEEKQDVSPAHAGSRKDDNLSSWGNRPDANGSPRPRLQKRTDQDRELSMMLKMHSRAFSQALMSIAGTRERSGRFWMTFLATFIVMALLIMQVAYRHRELNLGYELSASISQREALLEENRKLRIELRSLRERQEPLAGRQLGMSPIRPEQVFIVNTDTVKTKKFEPGKRLDGLDNVRRIGED